MVIAGKDRGASGAIVRVLPKRDLVLIDGINVVTRHRRPSAKNRKGQIVEKALPIHASNVQLVDPKSGKPTRIKVVRTDGLRQRVAVKSGADIT